MTEGGSTFLWARPALGRMGPQRFFLEEKLTLNNPSDLRFQHGTVFLYPKFENKKKTKIQRVQPCTYCSDEIGWNSVGQNQ